MRIRLSRSGTLAVVAVVALAVAIPFGVAAFEDSPPAIEVHPQPTASQQATPSTAAREVAVDYHDAVEGAEVASRLEAQGYTVAASAAVRVTDVAPSAADVAAGTHTIEVRLQSYALVVHPRAPLYDQSRETLLSILNLEDGAGLGGPFVTTAGGPNASATVGANRLVVLPSSDAVMDYVIEHPTAVGVVPVEDLAPRVGALAWPEYDPYRDSATTNPIADTRWVTGPDNGDAEEVVAALGWEREPPPEPVSFLATGELIPTRCVSDRVVALEDGYDAIFDGTRDLIARADLAMSQWEPAVIEGAATPCTPTFNLSTSPGAAQAAANAGVDVVLAAGNHMGDCWPGCGFQDAVLETLRHLRDAGFAVTGAGEDLEAARTPAIVERDGITFAFLGYDDIAYAHYGATETTAGTARADLDGIAADVRAAAAQADHVIVGFSWGVEYTTAPTDRQRELAHAAIDAGASLVVGNHPHWVQATEWVGDGLVVYALGNFVFDQDWSVETSQGAILEAGFTRDRLLGVRLYPTAVRQQHAVELLNPAEGEGASILQRIWDATDAVPPK